MIVCINRKLPLLARPSMIAAMPSPKVGRKPAKKPDETKGAGALFVRDADLTEKLDAWVEKLNAANPDGPQWNRASLARAALRRALRERGEKGALP